MKKYAIQFIVLAVLLVACAVVPITGRRQLSLVPEATINQMSLTQYDSIIQYQQNRQWAKRPDDQNGRRTNR